MKNSGQCIKCQSTKIIRIPSSKFGKHGSNSVSVGWLKAGQAQVTRYLCCHCGYSEEWIDQPKDIKRIEDSYDKHELDDFV